MGRSRAASRRSAPEERPSTHYLRGDIYGMRARVIDRSTSAGLLKVPASQLKPAAALLHRTADGLGQGSKSVEARPEHVEIAGE
jgi:hypothetical protein